MRIIERTSEHLRVRIRSNFPPKAEVAVYDSAGVTLVVDEISLASEKARVALCSKLSPLHAPIAASLLQEIAAEFAAPVSQEVDQSGDPALAELEPWPDPVDGSALLQTIQTELCRYVLLPPHGSVAVTLWIAHTHLMPVVGEYSPILAIISPEKRCGKTTLLTLLELLTHKAVSITYLNQANLYRTIATGYVTLLLDEADTYLIRNSELIGLINRGHTRRGAYTIRQEKTESGFVTTRFSLWAAKAIASIGVLWHTIADRAIRIPMRRMAKHESVERLKRADDERFKEIARKLRRWAVDNATELETIDPVLPEELDNRGMDNWRLLTAIADLVGGEWPLLARDAAVALRAPHADTATPGIQLLTDLRAVLRDSKAQFLRTSELLNKLHAYDEYWIKYSYGKPLDANALANLLRPFDIVTDRQRIPGYKDAQRGYHRAPLDEAFNDYLPPDDHPSRPSRPVGDVPSVPGVPGVSDDENAPPEPEKGGAQ